MKKKTQGATYRYLQNQLVTWLTDISLTIYVMILSVHKVDFLMQPVDLGFFIVVKGSVGLTLNFFYTF